MSEMSNSSVRILTTTQNYYAIDMRSKITTPTEEQHGDDDVFELDDKNTRYIWKQKFFSYYVSIIQLIT